MTYAGFQNQVLFKLGTKLDHLAISEIIPLLKQLDRMKDRGFTVEDAYQFMLCTEEVNPDLDEDVALARMSEISKNYLSY